MKKILLIVLLSLIAILPLHAKKGSGLYFITGMSSSVLSGDEEIISGVHVVNNHSKQGYFMSFSSLNLYNGKAVLVEPGVRIIQRGFGSGHHEVTSSYMDVFLNFRYNVMRNKRSAVDIHPYVGASLSTLLYSNDYCTEMLDVIGKAGLDVIMYKMWSVGGEYNQGFIQALDGRDVYNQGLLVRIGYLF